MSGCAFIFLSLNELLLSLAGHVSAIGYANSLYRLFQTALLLIASIDDTMILKLGQEFTFPAKLTDFDMGFSVVAEEEVLIISICLYPVLQLHVLEQLQVSLCFEVLRLVLKQELLVVSVVKDVGIHDPACMRTLHFLAAEAKGEGTHQSNELLRAQIALGQALHNETASISLSCMLNSITF